MGAGTFSPTSRKVLALHWRNYRGNSFTDYRQASSQNLVVACFHALFVPLLLLLLLCKFAAQITGRW